MGGWEKASTELTELLDRALAGFDQSGRFMFGGPANKPKPPKRPEAS